MKNRERNIAAWNAHYNGTFYTDSFTGVTICTGKVPPGGFYAGSLVMSIWKPLSKGKPWLNCRYKSESDLVKAACGYLKSFKEAKEMKMAARSKAKSNPGHPFKIGDVFVNTWGYDQTNADYYEIVRATAKTVWVREIGAKVVDDNESRGSYSVKPDRGNFVGPEIMKRPVFGEWYKKDEGYYLSFDHGWTNKVKGDEATGITHPMCHR